jgi:O-acetyl-ADP-ribose deacetylase (regulator of RNase III)/uncharacterized protein YwgA
MLQVRIGNVLESSAQTLVNTVNCVGIMGKGIALDFKKRFPDMFKDYAARCTRGEVRLGEPYVFKTLLPPWILNFPTKKDWRSVSRESDIVAGLEYLEKHYREWGIESLAVPPLGCGNGGLEWSSVGPILFNHLSRLDIPVELFAPYATPREQLTSDFLSQARMAVGKGSRVPARVEPAWVALVAILDRISREPYHWPVGRTTFQKIAYFATAEGLPTGLAHARGSYGPFAEDLKAIESRLINNNLLQEEERGRMILVKPGPEFERVATEMRAGLQRWEPIVERVADLFLRISTTHQAEIAATVAFTARALQRSTGTKPTEQAVLNEVKRWKQRRNPAPEETEVASFIRDLATLGWVDVEPSPDLPLHDELAVEA